MSHVAICKTEPGKPLIVDLEAVKLAAMNLGMTCEERNTYKWYGRHVGDYPVPPGYSISDLGRNAVLVLSVTPELRAKHGLSENCYELAVVEDRQNPGCYTYMYDFYNGGYGLDKVIGKPVTEDGKVVTVAPQFLMHYRMCADALSAQEAGDQIEFEEQTDGSWKSFVTPNENRLRS